MKYANVIATKDQEREALNKIVKIIESLGEGSYIDIAFEGCIELARENIENDSMVSMKQKFEYSQKSLDEYLKELDKVTDQKERFSREVHKLNEKLDKKDERIKELLQDQNELSEYITKLHNEIADFKDQINATKQENLELKAKLYDILIKTA